MKDCITVTACGTALLADPLTNKGTTFPADERVPPS